MQDGLVGNTTLRNNALTAGLPANFFVANPDMLGGANLTTNIRRGLLLVRDVDR